MLRVTEGDGFLVAFLSMERSLLGLAGSHLFSAGLGFGVALGFGSLESRAASSRRWQEEWLLLLSLSCALERRLAAMRAMLLVPRAISFRAWALRAGLPASLISQGVPNSKPAEGLSLEMRLFMVRVLGFRWESAPKGKVSGHWLSLCCQRISVVWNRLRDSDLRPGSRHPGSSLGQSFS